MAVTLLKALADPGRLLLARVLSLGTFNVSELTEIADAGQSTVSRNLKILVDAGLLSSRREGRTVYYAWRRDLAPAAASLRTWVEAHGPAIEGDVRRQIHDAWEARRERTASFFATVDPADPAAAWLGSPDCLPLLLEALPDSNTVVDLGTGSGRLLPGLRGRAPNVIGVDASAAMLSEARRRTQDAGLDDIDLRLGDLAHLPLQDHEADAVVANMVLHHLPEPARAFDEIKRVLRPGGTLLIGDFLPHDQEWMRETLADQWLGLAPDDVSHWLDEGGFEAIDVRPIPPNQPGALGVFVARATRV
ncbi:MAG: metalloregulator ArsR/SmtB family transcription factor [Proteobacteria bacterium]|nr:metalloregulator ArsR/SmtB family transcription factor [Pseudomonadota bacterium]